MAKKTKTISQLKKEADAVFSQWVRRSAEEEDGLVKCVTCPNRLPWKEMQAGHYETRGTLVLRYDERNVHPQCVGCNVFKKGNYPRYATWMVKEYGPYILKELEDEAKVIVNDSRSLYEAVIEDYKLKLKEMDNA